MPQRRAALEKLVLHATNLRIPIVEVEGGSLTALAGFDGHQGIALVVEPRRYAGLADILARAAERGEPPFVLVLDSLQDPHNVGSLLRSAEAAGVHGVIFPSTRQAPLSPSAVKASAGAIEHLLLAPVDDLPGALSDLHARGLRVAGADGDAPLTASQADLRGPLAIVVGSEGQGLGPAVRRRCDLFVRIPMRGAVRSLNAAVAGSILVFEAVSQRDLPDPGRRPSPATEEPATEPPAATTAETDEAAAEEPTAEGPPVPTTAAPAGAIEELSAAPSKPTRRRKPTRASASEAGQPPEPPDAPKRATSRRTAKAAPEPPAEASPESGDDDLLPEPAPVRKRATRTSAEPPSDPDVA